MHSAYFELFYVVVVPLQKSKMPIKTWGLTEAKDQGVKRIVNAGQ